MENVVYPNHLGIIMDGNGRWAKKRGINRSLGHKAGADNLINLLDYIYKNTSIKVVSLYAFSTENFKRDKSEVDYLMRLFVALFNSKLESIKKNNVKVVFSGRRENLPKSVLEAMDKTTDDTKNNTRGILNICLNYGGDYEIVDMAKKVAKQVLEGTLNIDDITKEVVSKNLYQDLPPLDFVIRTSGEMRISNFMIYQSSYAEYDFPDTYFPDFDSKCLEESLDNYRKRDRRFGNAK